MLSTSPRADDPVAVYLPGWIAKNERLGNIRPKVAYTYGGYARREVTPRIGRLRLDAVRPAHVQGIVDAMLEKGRAPRTVTQVHRITHAAFRDAVRLSVLRSNPADGVKLPRLPKGGLTIPKPADVRRLLRVVQSEYRAPLALAAGTGTRRGEVLALRWPAVELDDGRPRISIEGTLQRTPAGLVVENPKTDHSRREVPLSSSLVAILRAHRKEQLERRLLAGMRGPRVTMSSIAATEGRSTRTPSEPRFGVPASGWVSTVCDSMMCGMASRACS